MTSIDVANARSCIVKKANELIQQSRFSLTLMQQKIVLYLISQIRANDTDFKEYQFSITNFCDICGIDVSGGRVYEMVKDAIDEITKKQVWITLENGKETNVRWIEKAYLDKKNSTISIRLDKDMKPFLLQLQNNFTKYELFWTLQFKRKYSVRLYELINSIHYHPLAPYEKTYKLEELRRLLDAETYNTYQTFKMRVLNPAIEEVNAYSDKIVKYYPIKNGKSVESIKLIISSKETAEIWNLRVAQEREMNGFLKEEKEKAQL